MYEAIVKRHRPRGWRVSFTKRKDEVADDLRKHPDKAPKFDVACSYPECRLFHIPHVVDAFTLHIALHEFGHVHLRHWDRGESLLHREEYEAERWAINIMRMEGVKVPRETMRRARVYVRWCIKHDEAAGRPIHVPARRFVGG
jgi:hypothetical protein